MFLDYNMKKLILLVVSFVCFALPDDGSLAIVKLDALGISKKEARSLTERITSQMISCGKYTVLDRVNTDKILDEMKFQSSGCTDTKCAIEVGKILNAHYILVGSVSTFGNNFIIDCRIINVETSEAVKSASFTTRKNLDKLLQGTKNIVSQLCDIDIEEINNQSIENKKSNNLKKKALARSIYRTGGLYFGYNFFGEFKFDSGLESGNNQYDNAGFTLGYEVGKLLSKNEFGISLDIGGFESSERLSSDSFLNSYWKRNFSKSRTYNFWTSLGYNITLGQLDKEDWVGRYSVGLGLEGDRFEIGCLINKSRSDAPESYFDVVRMFVNYNFPKFNYLDKKKKQQKKKQFQKKKNRRRNN